MEKDSYFPESNGTHDALIRPCASCGIDVQERSNRMTCQWLGQLSDKHKDKK